MWLGNTSLKELEEKRALAIPVVVHLFKWDNGRYNLEIQIFDHRKHAGQGLI